MSARIPEQDVRDFLAALLGAPFGAADVNIRCGYPHSPLQPGTSAVGVWVDASERGPQKYYGAGGNYFTADIDVKVVSAPDDLDGGWRIGRIRRLPTSSRRKELGGTGDAAHPRFATCSCGYSAYIERLRVGTEHDEEHPRRR